MSEEFSPLQAEFHALAELAGLDSTKMANAFNDPEHFFEHLSLTDLRQFTEMSVRVSSLMSRMVAATDLYTSYARGLLEGGKAS